LWLTGVSINGAGNDIGVQGRAMQATLIPNYIARLTGERVMRGKTFASLDIGRPEAAARRLHRRRPGGRAIRRVQPAIDRRRRQMKQQLLQQWIKLSTSWTP
jgi:hypothetical protein